MNTHIKSFYLPDLGEGLAEAEIVTWYVTEGSHVNEDDPIVSVETAKALVDVPSPVTGIIIKIHVPDGSLVPTHCLLAEFEVHNEAHNSEAHNTDVQSISSQPTSSQSTQDNTAQTTSNLTNTHIDDTVTNAEFKKNRPDSGTVVGKMNTTTQVSDDFFIIGKNRPKQPEQQPLPSPFMRKQTSHTATHATTHTTAQTIDLYNTETIRGSRRTMAETMQLSRDTIAQVTLFDQADITAWFEKKHITSQLIHAICEASKEVPRLNAWFDMEKRELHIHHHVNLGLAVDTEDGLFVPVLHHINRSPQCKIRQVVDSVIDEVHNRTAPPERFKKATIILSNFGAIAGRFATPMVVPPMVAILGAGRYFEMPQVEKNKKGKTNIHIRKILPLSLSFDHRAATGGEGARFLQSLINQLEN